MITYVPPPPAYVQNALAYDLTSDLQGDDGRALMCLMNQVWHHWTERPSLAGQHVVIPALDLDGSEQEFRAYLAQQGLDFDTLHEDAGRHFVSPAIHPRTTPLTAEERIAAARDDFDGVNV